MAAPMPRNRARPLALRSLALGALLIPLAQAGLGVLSAHTSSPWYWLVGTPLAYFLIATLAAFSATEHPGWRPAHSQGTLSGLITGSAGAVSATLIATIIVALYLHNQPQPLSYAPLQHGSGPQVIIGAVPVPIPAIVFVLFFAPFFLAINLLGIGLATLGGMLGGYLKARFTRQAATAQEPMARRPGAARSFALVGIIILLAILVLIAAIMFLTGAFTAVSGALAHNALA